MRLALKPMIKNGRLVTLLTANSSLRPVWVARLAQLSLIGIMLCACAGGAPRSAGETPAPARTGLVFVGTYTRGPGGVERSAGIFTYRMDAQTGALTLLNKTGGPPNPSYLTVDPSRRYLLAVSETGEFDGQPGGAVSSYAIDATSGALTLLNSQPTHGADPCYVSVDPSGKWVLVANYSGGSLTVLPFAADGRLGTATALVQHQGSSVNPDRQSAPHAHSVVFLPGAPNRVLAADLGLDQVLVYDFSSEKGTLTAHSIPFLALAPGAGPRHMVFHPTLPYLYVLNELASTVTIFRDTLPTGKPTDGQFQEVETVSLRPNGAGGPNASADIHVSPSGKFLYASNRGDDTLAIFSIAQDSGKLTLVGHVSTDGKTPRNFALSPDGTFLLAANQDSGSIVTFRVDAATGQLTPTGAQTALDSPVCVKFLDAP